MRPSVVSVELCQQSDERPRQVRVHSHVVRADTSKFPSYTLSYTDETGMAGSALEIRAVPSGSKASRAVGRVQGLFGRVHHAIPTGRLNVGR